MDFSDYLYKQGNITEEDYKKIKEDNGTKVCDTILRHHLMNYHQITDSFSQYLQIRNSH